MSSASSSVNALALRKLDFIDAKDNSYVHLAQSLKTGDTYFNCRFSQEKECNCAKTSEREPLNQPFGERTPKEQKIIEYCQKVPREKGDNGSLNAFFKNNCAIYTNGRGIADCKETNLSYSNLSYGRFDEADFSGTIFFKAELKETSFNRTQLSGANFTDVKFLTATQLSKGLFGTSENEQLIANDTPTRKLIHRAYKRKRLRELFEFRCKLEAYINAFRRQHTDPSELTTEEKILLEEPEMQGYIQYLTAHK